MAQLFGHEKLKVYQKALGFAAIRSTLLDGLPRRVAACDHLDRAAESILVNIAHASSSWSPKDRVVYLGHANGSALAKLRLKPTSATSAWDGGTGFVGIEDERRPMHPQNPRKRRRLE